MTAVALGGTYVLALKADGTVVAWGNEDNEYGLPKTMTQVPRGLRDVKAIAAGPYHALALKKNGKVVGWGENTSGELTFPSDLPPVRAITTGAASSSLLLEDGTVRSYGYNGDDGSTTVPPGLSGVTAIASYFLHTLALKSDGTLVGWGYNTYGQATTTGISGISAISVGASHSVAMTDAHSTLTWPKTLTGKQRTVQVFIRNQGDSPLHLGALTVGGEQANNFYSTVPSAAWVPAGGHMAISLTFQPTLIGQHQAWISIPSSRPLGSPSIINLSGVGQLPTIRVDAPPPPPPWERTSFPFTTGMVLASFDKVFTQTGGFGKVTFELESGTVPDGLELDADGRLSGYPTRAGAFNMRVRATDEVGARGRSPNLRIFIVPDASLADLQLAGVSLSPAFHHDNTRYDGTVDNSVTAISVTAQARGQAPIKVNGRAVISGEPSKAIRLKVGRNRITVAVGEGLFFGKTYVVDLVRESPN